MNPYTPNFYSLQCSENLKFFFQKIHSQIPNGELGEISMELITAINGKSKRLPIFYTARDGAIYENRYVPPNILQLQASTEPKLREEYEVFLELIITHYCKKTGIQRADAKEHIEQAIGTYLKAFGDKLRKKAPWKFRAKELISSFLKLFIPEFLLLYRRRLRIKQARDKSGYPFFDKEANKEWKIIESFVMKHNL
jgi:hypothetical protein